MESLETLTKEQVAGELQATSPCLEAGFEKRMESLEKLTNEQFAGELQALQTAGEQAARDLASANDRQATLGTRMESMEKLTKEQVAETAAAAPKRRKWPSSRFSPHSAVIDISDDAVVIDVQDGTWGQSEQIKLMQMLAYEFQPGGSEHDKFKSEPPPSPPTSPTSSRPAAVSPAAASASFEVISSQPPEMLELGRCETRDFYGRLLYDVDPTPLDPEYWQDGNLKPWVYWPEQASTWLVATRLPLRPWTQADRDRAGHARPLPLEETSKPLKRLRRS